MLSYEESWNEIEKQFKKKKEYWLAQDSQGENFSKFSKENAIMELVNEYKGNNCEIYETRPFRHEKLNDFAFFDYIQMFMEKIHGKNFLPEYEKLEIEDKSYDFSSFKKEKIIDEECFIVGQYENDDVEVLLGRSVENPMLHVYSVKDKVTAFEKHISGDLKVYDFNYIKNMLDSEIQVRDILISKNCDMEDLKENFIYEDSATKQVGYLYKALQLNGSVRKQAEELTDVYMNCQLFIKRFDQFYYDKFLDRRLAIESTVTKFEHFIETGEIKYWYPDEVRREELEKYYNVEITEILSEIICVKANSVKEAREKVEEMYRKEKVVLDSSNYVNTKFKVITNAKSIKSDLC